MSGLRYYRNSYVLCSVWSVGSHNTVAPPSLPSRWRCARGAGRRQDKMAWILARLCQYPLLKSPSPALRKWATMTTSAPILTRSVGSQADGWRSGGWTATSYLVQSASERWLNDSHHPKGRHPRSTPGHPPSVPHGLRRQRLNLVPSAKRPCRPPSALVNPPLSSALKAPGRRPTLPSRHVFLRHQLLRAPSKCAHLCSTMRPCSAAPST